MKKCLILLLVLVPFMLIIGGCAPASTDDVYEILWYHSFGAQLDEDLYEEFFTPLNEYLTEKIGVTLNFNNIDDFGTRMNLIATSGEPWDLAFTAGWLNPFNYFESARNGYFHPLNDLLEEHGQGILDALHPAWFEGVRIDGEVYGIPTQKEIGATPVHVMSKKIIDQYGIDPNQDSSFTFDIFEPYLAQFKQDYPNDYPLWPEQMPGAINNQKDLVWLDSSQRLPFVLYADGRDNQVYNMFEVPEQVALYNKLKEYILAGYIHPDLPTLASIGEQITNILSEGNFMAKYDLAFPGAGDILSERYRTPTYFTYVAKPIVSSASIAGSMMVINANSERPDKVMQFLNLLNTDPYVRNSLNYGIEGTHYNKVSENRIEKVEGANWPFGQWTLQNYFILWLTEGLPDDHWEQFADFNSSAIVAPSFGFEPNFDPIRGEIDAITNTMEEYSDFLYRDATVAEMITEIMDRLQSDGIERAIAELQSQYTTWKNSQ